MNKHFLERYIHPRQDCACSNLRFIFTIRIKIRNVRIFDFDWILNSNFWCHMLPVSEMKWDEKYIVYQFIYEITKQFWYTLYLKHFVFSWTPNLTLIINRPLVNSKENKENFLMFMTQALVSVIKCQCNNNRRYLTPIYIEFPFVNCNSCHLRFQTKSSGKMLTSGYYCRLLNFIV